MAHESVVGNNQYIYNITLPASFASVGSLLSANQLAELGSFDILDGYIVSDAGDFHIAHDPNLTYGTYEAFTASGYAFFPFLDWTNRVFIRTSGGVPIARVKIMTGFIERRK